MTRPDDTDDDPASASGSMALEASESMVIEAVDETSPRRRVDASRVASSSDAAVDDAAGDAGSSMTLEASESMVIEAVDETSPKNRSDA